MEMPVNIGEKIKNLRLKNGLTQEELADRCELSKGFISLVEHNQTSPSITTLGDILDALGTDFAKFFKEGQPVTDHVLEDRVRGWMPVIGRDDVCVHFAVMIPEGQV